MIFRITGEAHSFSYVTNRQGANQPGETLKCKGYFYTVPKSSNTALNLSRYGKLISPGKKTAPTKVGNAELPRITPCVQRF
jgi:hypothetical protein